MYVFKCLPAAFFVAYVDSEKITKDLNKTKIVFVSGWLVENYQKWACFIMAWNHAVPRVGTSISPNVK